MINDLGLMINEYLKRKITKFILRSSKFEVQSVSAGGGEINEL